MKRLFGLSSVLLVVLCSCARSPQGDESVAPEPPRIPRTEVASALQSLSDQLQRQVQSLATELEASIPTDAVRKVTLGWRIRTFEICARARSRDNAMAGLIELWFWTAARTRHYQTGSGKALFGEQQKLVLDRSIELELIAENMVRRAVPPERFEVLHKQVIDATAQGDAYLAGDSTKSDPLASILEVTKLSSLLAIPLSPFDAFTGVKTGADAAARMAVTADRAVELMADYPKLLSWHMQRALLEMQSQDTPQSLLSELKRTNASIEALTVIARNLPAQVRVEGLALLDQSRPAQVDVRETLAALTEAAKALEHLNAGILQFVARVTPAPGTAVKAPSDHPFDIRDYTTALNAATVTAEKLQTTLRATSAIIDSPAISIHVTEASQTLDALIARIAWWTLAVILFANICVYTCIRLLRQIK